MINLGSKETESMPKAFHPPSTSPGFTIVELLVVIVVIGVLAAITIVSYTGISARAVVASLQSDLANASKQLELFQVTYGNYPDTIYCGIADSSANKCIKSSSGNSLSYSVNNSVSPQTFGLSATNSNNVYSVTNSSNLKPCPLDYIEVPGSATYSTSNFCVMKYEAKNVSGVATSQASGDPWISISQTAAISTAASACGGCHLITEAGWLTIAQNVLSNPSNWNGGGSWN